MNPDNSTYSAEIYVGFFMGYLEAARSPEAELVYNRHLQLACYILAMEQGADHQENGLVIYQESLPDRLQMRGEISPSEFGDQVRRAAALLPKSASRKTSIEVLSGLSVGAITYTDVPNQLVAPAA